MAQSSKLTIHRPTYPRLYNLCIYCMVRKQFQYLHFITHTVKGKGTVHLKTGHEGPEWEYGYSYTLSLTSALDGVGGQRHAPGKTRYPLYSRLGGQQDRSGRVRKISPPPGFEPWTVQPVASRYTDWALPSHIHTVKTRCS